MRKRYVAPLLACVSLVVPASASAHARSATVALDYRLVLDASTKGLAGVSVAILDGDRDLRLRVHGTTLVVRGDLGEPMLRLAPSGTWVNRASVTAAAERLTTAGHGWVKRRFRLELHVARAPARPAAVRRLAARQRGPLHDPGHRRRQAGHDRRQLRALRQTAAVALAARRGGACRGSGGRREAMAGAAG